MVQDIILIYTYTIIKYNFNGISHQCPFCEVRMRLVNQRQGCKKGIHVCLYLCMHAYVCMSGQRLGIHSFALSSKALRLKVIPRRPD